MISLIINLGLLIIGCVLLIIKLAGLSNVVLFGSEVGHFGHQLGSRKNGGVVGRPATGAAAATLPVLVAGRELLRPPKIKMKWE